MKSIKIYLIIVSVLLVFAIGAGVYVWYVVQQIQTEPETFIESHTEVTGVDEKREGKLPETPITDSSDIPEPVTVKVESLPASQQELLKAFGYSQNDLTVTPTMIACAEDALGHDRMEAILKGMAPSPLESLKLLPCFKK